MNSIATSTSPMFPGMLHDAAARLAVDFFDTISGTASSQAWAQAAASAWPGVLIAEDFDGIGGTLADMAAIVEGLAQHGAALPVIERCAVAPWLLHDAAIRDAQGPAAALLRGMADGTRQVAVLSAGEGICPGGSPAIDATQDADGTWTLAASALQCSAEAPATDVLWVARVHAPEAPDPTTMLLCTPFDALDGSMTRRLAADGRAMRQLDGVRVPAAGSTRLAEGPRLLQQAQEADAIAMFLGCIDTVAALSALIAQSIAHLETRVQFGAALSSFQVLRHKAVDMSLVLEAGRGLVAGCLRALDAGAQSAAREVQLTKMYLGTAGRSAAETAIQLHGAMGMSEELPAARLARRIVVNDFRHGDRLVHETALAASLARHIGSVWQ